MTKVAEVFVPIDRRLRFVFFGLECALGVTLYPLETERVFQDCQNDQVSAKSYLFHDSRALRVSGKVDEYEHEDLILRIEGVRSLQNVLQRVVDGADALLRDLDRFRDENDED